MTTITEILEEKKQQIMVEGNPLCVSFTLADITVLSDLTALRQWKLTNGVTCDGFKPSIDIYACTYDILNYGDPFRVLEFCMLKNKVLEKPICQVFSSLRR